MRKERNEADTCAHMGLAGYAHGLPRGHYEACAGAQGAPRTPMRGRAHQAIDRPNDCRDTTYTMHRLLGLSSAPLPSSKEPCQR